MATILLEQVPELLGVVRHNMAPLTETSVLQVSNDGSNMATILPEQVPELL